MLERVMNKTMIITKQELLEIINHTILKTCESCEKKLSFEERFIIMLDVFIYADWGKYGTNKKATSKATH